MNKSKINREHNLTNNAQRTLKNIKRQVKGITLIALVVTIIVLLILAGVAISLTIGNNGIFTRAQVAVVKNENANIYEQLQFVVADYQMDAIETSNEEKILSRLKTDGYVNNENTLNVDTLMGKSMQTGKGSKDTGDVYVLEKRTTTATEVTSDVSVNMKYYLIYYDEDNIDINLGLAFEESEPLDWNEIFENAQKHPEQNQINEVIGIDEYGNPVNMDLWNSEKTEDGKGYNLQGVGGSGAGTPAYLGEIINGKIEGEIPKYIKKMDDSKFYPVIGLEATFAGLNELVYPPKIPNGVINMDFTFDACKKLKNTPKIPDSVIYMNGTYWACISLTESATIPNSVEELRYAFCDCIGLIKAPTIPDSVIDMYSTFGGCINLTGTLEINANPSFYNDCFYNTATSEGANLVLTGTSTKLQELLATKSYDSNISIQ